jgi:PncC family amidohydrolase
MMKKIKDLLSENKLTISVAESLTGGMVQSKMAKLPGSSYFFKGGITAYDINQKVNHLGVDWKLAHLCNCVSKEVASQMSEGVAKMFGSSIGVSTTGYAEPDILHKVGVPHAFISIWFNGLSITKKIIGTVEMTRTKMRTHVTNEILKEIPPFVNHVLNSKNRTIKSMIDSGELKLIPNKTIIEIKGKLLNNEATFLRHDQDHGYVFCDTFDELHIYKSLDDKSICYKRVKQKNKFTSPGVSIYEHD